MNDAADTLYRQIAADLSTQIRSGVMRAGSRLPSIRQLARQRQVSISTAIRSMQVLDESGLVEARPQSGYYVRPPRTRLGAHPFQWTAFRLSSVISSSSSSSIIPSNRGLPPKAAEALGSCG
jgi:DNA-binding GntR family transcriptional regulator